MCLHAGGQGRNVWYVQVRVLLNVSRQVEPPLGIQRKPLEFRVSEEDLVCWCGRGSLDDQLHVSPSSRTGKGVGSSASPGLGAALRALSMPLLSKLRAAATCERKLCPLGTSHWSIPKRLRNGEKGALSRSLVKEPQPEHDLNQWGPPFSSETSCSATYWQKFSNRQFKGIC